MAESITEVLTRAADLLDERGWCRRWFADGAGRLCLAGAIGVAVGGTPPQYGADGQVWQFPTDDAEQLWHWLLTTLERTSPGRRLFRWNDDPDRTADEVKALLRDAAQREGGHV